jgi:predicted peptidase
MLDATEPLKSLESLKSSNVPACSGFNDFNGLDDLIQRPEWKERIVNLLCLIFLILLPLVVFIGSVSATEAGDTQAGQRECVFEAQIVKTVRLNYLLFLPKGYGEDSQQKWPLILFLHGAGERGDDLKLVKVHGIPKIVEQKEDFPFIAISPQCPGFSWWTVELETLNALLDEVISNYAVDTDRVYLTGLSMGGFATWQLATAYPKRFAAIAPVCGGGDPKKAKALKDVPVWAFHGAKDEVVPLARSEEMVKALKDCGGDARLTVYPEAGHDSWTETYDNPKLYEWFLKHTRRER